jgi:predicted nucleic acid-binding protein
VIFVDTNVLMYAVGRPHPLRGPARRFFEDAVKRQRALATSAEVLQELLHAYLPAGRTETLDSALDLAASTIRNVWAVEGSDVRFARHLASRHPKLAARDLLHLACCKRRKVPKVMSFDRALSAAFRKGG